MARPKRQKAFEIDFPFPKRERDIIFKEDGSSRYTIPQLIAFAANGNDYSKEFSKSVGEYYQTHGNTITSSQQWTLENLACRHSPEWDEMNKKFFEWYDSRPDMQKMYEAASPNQWWFYDRNGQHHNKNEAEANGWLTRPDNWQMFERTAYSHEGSKYRELNRDIVYDIGDQVVLRKPFVGSYRYDPCYGDSSLYGIDRVGMVVEHKDDITRRSRGGKGSRLINVLWMQKGEQSQIPERCIKKYRSK